MRREWCNSEKENRGTKMITGTAAKMQEEGAAPIPPLKAKD